MYCKNCGKGLSDTEEFCVNCGTKVKNDNNIFEVNNFEKNVQNSTISNINYLNNNEQLKTHNNLKSAFITSIISFVLFVIVALIFIIFCYLYCKDNSGMSFPFIITPFILAFFPFLVSIILSIVSFFSYKKCDNFELKGKHKTFKILNILQLPIILIILIVCLNAKDVYRNNIIDEKLSSLYNNNYEVIKTCSHGDASGSDYEFVALRLQSFPMPIIAKFDWAYDDYGDNYDELKEMIELDYQTHINNVFKSKTIALMDIYRNDKYDIKNIYLNILITENQIIDRETLKNNIEEISKKYVYMFPDYVFIFQLDVINEINENKMEQYYLFLSGEKGHCTGELNDNLELSSEIGVSFLLEEGENIEAVINDSIDIFYKENNY